jgi:NADPH2:quinone reductase
MKTQAIRIETTGGPEVMRLTEIDLPDPAPDQVQVNIRACGVNFIDTYQRSGLYPLALPSGLGNEAAGIVSKVGSAVRHLREGDRVAYASGPAGTYAQAHNAPANRVAKLPDSIGFEEGAAMMLKGLTVRYLFKETYPLKSGETILFHAAAGGVGLIACQWARHLGVNMIGTVGSEEKARLAREHGCAHTILYRSEDVPAKVRAITGGRGVPVVYDSVGKATFDASLDCLQRRGLMVSFGNASGPVTGVNLGLLMTKGSLYVTRPTAAHYLSTDEEFNTAVADLFAVVGSGAVKIPVRHRYPLSEAVRCHEDLEGRRTTGASVLLP